MLIIEIEKKNKIKYLTVEKNQRPKNIEKKRTLSN